MQWAYQSDREHRSDCNIADSRQRQPSDDERLEFFEPSELFHLACLDRESQSADYKSMLALDDW